MKNKKFILEAEEEERRVGLLRLAHRMEDYEFFFKLNRINPFKFSRLEDVEMDDYSLVYQFARYQTYDEATRTIYSFVANKSHHAQKKTDVIDLFSDLYEPMYIFPQYPEVDYILLIKDVFTKFSVILLPEQLTFPLQEVVLSPEQKFYQTIQYYE